MQPQVLVAVARVAAQVSWLILGVSCSGGNREAARTLERDSAGIAIVENEDYRNWQSCSMHQDSTYLSSNDDNAFYRVSGASAGDLGVVVVNSGNHEVRVYTAAGELVHRFGRRGEGPGEFRQPWRVWLAGDTILVEDFRPWRAQLFKQDGSYLGVRLYDFNIINPPPYVGRLAPGHWLVGQNRSSQLGPSARTDTIDLTLFRVDGAQQPLGKLPYGEFHRVASSAFSMNVEPLFESRGVASAGDAVVVIGRGDQRELEMRDESGNLTKLIRWAGPARRVTDDDIRAFRERTMSDATDDMARRFASVLSSSDRPVRREFPPHASIMIAPTGELWVKEYPRPQDNHQRWLQFSRTGRGLCTLQLAPRDQMLHGGRAHVIVKILDELDREHVLLMGRATE